MKIKKTRIICAKCDGKIEPNRRGKQGYCKSCHAEYMREHRPKHSELTPEQRLKANCRSYLHVYIKRGKIKKENCKVCNYSKVEAHHKDYNKPLEVIWLCNQHHNMVTNRQIIL